MNPIRLIRTHGRKTAADVKPNAALNGGKHLGTGTLKQRYLQYFGARTHNAAALQGVVRDLIGQGISRQLLVIWAVEAGYTKAYVSSLLSRILVSLGLRERKRGAGRKPSPAALELLAYARDQYGESCLKVLRAAWRAGKAQRIAISSQKEARNCASNLIVGPQLQRPESNCGATIRRNISPTGRRNGSRYHSTTILFKKTLNPATRVNKMEMQLD
jgi:hypothetical protein